MPAGTTPARLRDLPNVGPATERDLNLLGVTEPAGLAGRDPVKMYDDLCRLTGARHDPCVIDVFMAAIACVETGDRRPWWAFSPRRRRLLARRAAGADPI
ncbi:MAG: mitomycin resistance protein [Planctomycetota bacterium]|nr:MAG: mitomycin resistance protein [Planctomycetota bacterium]